jgi:hypothetical protein
MRTSRKALFVSVLVFVPLCCNAQCSNGTSACSGGVPHFVKFNGTLKNLANKSQVSVVSIRFVIYGDSTGGTPLWEEVQNAELDSQGHYEVLLGATASEGIPMELFTSGEPRWLGVQPLLPGAEEEPRILLVSVPYALEAADAQTLGGLPPTAFAKAAPVATVQPTIPVVTTPAEVRVGAGIPGAATEPPPGLPAVRQSPNLDVVPKFSAGSSLVDSQITDADGMVSLQNLANILFADRFSGGVPDAVNTCPANGCVIYAVSPKVNLNLGTIDPGTKSITIYLGPYAFSVQQITLRKGLKIIGMGASGGTNGSVTCSTAKPCNGTTLQSTNGNNPVFVVPQDNNDPATNVLLSGFRLLGSAGNTSEDGLFLDTSATVNSGLWFSKFEDVQVIGFSGVGIHIKGRNNDFAALTQWVLFDNVTVSRNPGGGNALRLEGAVFELRFRNCEFDGQEIGDGTNIYIGGRSGGLNGYPISIAFEGLVSQQAATAAQIDGAVNVTFYGSHHEALWGAYQITNNTNIGTHGLTIVDGYFAGNVGANQGAGYLLNIATTVAAGVVFARNHIFGAADAILKGTNFNSVVYQDNLFHSSTGSLPPTSGLTTQMSPAPSIDIQGVHSIGLNPSATPITTIQSGLGPGEMVTFFTLDGAVTFAAGGNIDLMGLNSLTVNGTITLVRSDLGGLQWKVVSQWSPGLAGPSSPSSQSRGLASARP